MCMCVCVCVETDLDVAVISSKACESRRFEIKIDFRTQTVDSFVRPVRRKNKTVFVGTKTTYFHIVSEVGNKQNIEILWGISHYTRERVKCISFCLNYYVNCLSVLIARTNWTRTLVSLAFPRSFWWKITYFFFTFFCIYIYIAYTQRSTVVCLDNRLVKIYEY